MIDVVGLVLASNIAWACIREQGDVSMRVDGDKYTFTQMGGEDAEKSAKYQCFGKMAADEEAASEAAEAARKAAAVRAGGRE